MAVASLRQAALYTYTSKPKDTDFLLGKAFYKAGKLSEAGTVLKKYKPCPENEKEFQEILSQITPELNKTTNSLMLSRDSSQLTSFNNKDSHDIIEVSQKLNAVISIVVKHDQDIARHEQATADIKKMLQSANIPLTADINEQITKLKGIDPKLEEYYKYFNMAYVLLLVP
ncbi:hypothetical protein [Rickettsia tamurae]|uniref:hypothetical protein n=1 Tax=Rickettsia tamurae TaxID=334545 RepID=UPI000A6E3B03|nr:hypothetical protein [Rickettsia tamurae]